MWILWDDGVLGGSWGRGIMQEAVLGYNFLLSSAQWPKHSFATDNQSHRPN